MLTPAAIEYRFGAMPPSRVVMEVGTNSRWASRAVADLGHEVLIADPRQLKLISSSCTKSDRSDAELLARLGRADDLKLLKPVQHRSEQTHAALAVVRSRKVAVEARTQLINSVRGQLKAMGHRLGSCSTARFHELIEVLPDEAKEALSPLMASIAALNGAVKTYDRQIQLLGKEAFPETSHLRQVHGVGPLVALTFVLTIEDPHRFSNSRAVASYLGLVPRRYQSGDLDPQLRITKAGDRYMRTLLVQSAQRILGRFGADSDLRRWGLKLAGEGNRATKNKALVAVARKLSVLLLTLWKTGQDYDPFHESRVQVDPVPDVAQATESAPASPEAVSQSRPGSHSLVTPQGGQPGQAPVHGR